MPDLAGPGTAAVLCLSASGLAASLAISQFTLAWTHSIERIRWEEDWRIVGHTLVIAEARIRGSGAGMEIPAGAVLTHGVWRYLPALPPQAELTLAHSPYAAGYELCTTAGCAPLASHLPGLDNTSTILLRPCPE